MTKELLFSVTKKDLKVQTFKSGGPGGQHQNKKIALKRLVKHPKFKIWHSRKCMEIIEGKTIEEKVEEMMDEKNLKFEVKEEGKWTEVESQEVIKN